MTNKKEYKILRKALSLTLAMLVSILGIPLAKPQQVSATEASDPKYLSSINITATASSSWSDEGEYNGVFYEEIINNYDNYTTAETALKIDSAEKLAAFARAVNVGGKDFSGKYVKLTADINLQGTDLTVTNIDDGTDSNGNATFKVVVSGEAQNVWVPIGNDTTKFNGNFDGGNCEVKNMTVLVKQDSGDVYAGLFGYTESCTIQNTGVSGSVYASSSSYMYAGGLVGYNNNSSISNSYATCSVYASSNYRIMAGGLLGYNGSGSSVSNSYATGSVYASSSSSYSSSSYIRAGGLIGINNNSSISNSYATGSVHAGLYSICAGGLVGRNGSGSSVSNSYATGSVYASFHYVKAGGLVGYNDDSSVSNSVINSYATGSVYASAYTSSVYAGGLVGFNDYSSVSNSVINSYATGNVYASSYSYSACAGGLVGYSYYSSVSNSYATGNVYASSASDMVYAGGLAGENYNGSISNSYATGSVYASSYSYSACAGGLVGYNRSSSSSSSVSNSYATGNVYASSSSSSSKVYAGGLIGYNSNGSISNSYATGNVYASTDSAVYAGGLIGYNSNGSITNGYYYSGATIDGGTGATISNDGTGLTKDQMTGTTGGVDGRAQDKMEGFVDSNNWDFNDDGVGVKYLPRLKVITYNETTNPVPKFDVPTAEYFGFKAPTNLTYNGSQKVATVTSKISGITDDKITVKYYKDGSETSPINAGTYTVKIDVAAGDNYEAQTGITADHWTFTITKANPTIGSTSTTAAYKPGLTLGSVLPPSISETATAGSWIWSKSTAPISSAGEHYFEAKFKPTDSNYNEVTKCILVTVGKATLQASDFNFAAPSNLEYSADYKTATITRNSGIKGIGELTVKYFTKVNGELTPLGDSSLPTDVGTYYVGINVGDDINYNSASGLTSDSWNFTITPAGKHTYRLSNDSRVYLVTK